jgi:uncharacterized protein involved in outer membrane biogenesis
MRKLIIAIAAALVLFVVALFTLPMLFAGRALDMAVRTANDELDATVAIDRASVSMLRSFPHPSVGLHGVSVVGQGAFEGVTLASIDDLRLTVGLGTLLGETPELRELFIGTARFELVVDSEGRANWDVVPGDDEPEAEGGDDDFAIDLRDVVLEDVALRYDDQQGYTLVDIQGLAYGGEASIDGPITRMDNRARIASLTYRDGPVTWLKEVAVVAELPVEYASDSGAVTLGESSLALNELTMGFRGSVIPQGDDLALDISFQAMDNSFRSLLSLVPGAYTADFSEVETAGTLSLAGSVVGVLPAEGDDLPGFAVEAEVTDASVRMPDLPTGVDAIQLLLAVGHPGGDPDQITLDLDRFSMTVAGSPLTGSLRLRQPVSDPDVDLRIQGGLDLAELHKALPLEGVEYSGRLDLDLAVAGRMSQFESGRIAGVRAEGSFTLADAVYRDDALPVPVQVALFSGSISPRSTTIRSLSMTMGEPGQAGSDLSGSGRLDDLVPWFFDDTPLGGQIALKSSRFDTNPWLEDDGEDEAQADPDASSLVAVPRDLDLTVDADFDTVLYEDLELTDMQGEVLLRDGAARIQELDFTMLGGRVSMSGAYVAPTDQQADVELKVDMVGFDLGQVASSFETVRRIAPIAEQATGRFSTDFELATTLGSDLTPDLPTLISAGLLSSRSLVLQPAFMEQVGSKLGNDRYASIDLSKGELGFNIRNGRATLQPMAVEVGGAKGTLGGSTGVLDRSMDLTLDLAVPTRAIKASGLLEQLGASKGGKVDLQVRIGGTFDQPTVAVGAPGLADAVRDAVTEEVKERAGQVSDALVAEAQAAGDKLVAAAEKKREQLVAVAETQGGRLKEEAKNQAAKLAEKAEGKPLAEAAAKEAGRQLEKEARQAAKALVSEAEQKGDALVAAAETKRSELIAAAEVR